MLAEYLKHVDDYHEGYFLGVTFPHFIATHGWCGESFDLALAVIVQVRRANLNYDFDYLWREMAGAQRLYSPEDFAARMLAVRDAMYSSLDGNSSFACFAKAKASEKATFGCRNYDELFKEIDTRFKESKEQFKKIEEQFKQVKEKNDWDRQVFDELKRRS